MVKNQNMFIVSQDKSSFNSDTLVYNHLLMLQLGSFWENSSIIYNKQY